ncbi:MAG: hypothetical protein WCJ02_13065, partial [bacterium]
LIRCARIAQTVSLEDILKRLHAIRTSEPPAPAAAATPAQTATEFSYDDPALKQAIKMFDGKIVGVEDE